MTKVFHRTNLVQAWLAGIRYLATQKSHDSTNIILDIKQPMLATAQDKLVIEAVNAALKKKKASRSVMTAAGTIFPQTIYQRYGRPDWYEHYKTVITKGKVPGTWGTYVLRMIERKEATGEVFNPLDKIIEKLFSLRDDGRSRFKAAYELSVSNLESDLMDSCNGIGFELPTYNPASDRHMYMGSPCLSHVTFKLMNEKLEMTAIYRSHYYAERALGNLIGLAQLQRYVANESGFEQGPLTCISTYAKLDDGLGGIRATRKLLALLPLDETLTTTSPAPIF